jgi:hypothetical protein
MKKFLLFAVAILLGLNLLHAQSFKFAVLCDTRSNGYENGENGVNVSAVKAVCQHLKEQGAVLVLAPGDFICGNVKWYEPTPPANATQFQSFLKAAASQGIGLPGSNMEIPLYPVRGNHECYQQILPGDSIKAAWLKSIGYALPANGPKDEIGFTYSFTYNNSLFLGVDEYMHASSSQKKGIGLNQAWVNRVLKNNPKAKHVFVFGHTPAFAAHHKDCLGEQPLRRDVFLRSIYQRGDIYFCGHDHFYARAKVPVFKPDNSTIKGYIQQVITPSGAPFLTGNRSDNHKWDGEYQNKMVIPETYIDNAVGYQLVTVDKDKVTVQFIATYDACSYTKNSSGEYTYTFNNNWENWNFSIMDQFSLQKKNRSRQLVSK